MDYSKSTTATTAAEVAKAEGCPSLLSPTSSASADPFSPLPPQPPVILSPCGACRFLRRRCVENCILAPYFPPGDPLKFTVAHRVFGASNIIKLLQELPEDQRADAVTSMVYEANARLRDPIYGCTGAICHLQKQISELQGELAKARAEILNMQCQNASLSEQIHKQMATQNVQENLPPQIPLPYHENLTTFISEEGNLGVPWECLLDMTHYMEY